MGSYRGFGGAVISSAVRPMKLSSVPDMQFGKGILESNGSVVPVFGEPFNTPVPSTYDISIYQPTTNFNISSIYPGHEVVVAVVNFMYLYTSLSLSFDWWRLSDNVRAYSFSTEIPAPSTQGADYWLWYKIYTYIGYCPWEINSNGNYKLSCNAGGVITEKYLTVTGARRIISVHSKDRNASLPSNNIKLKVVNGSTKGGVAVGASLRTELTIDSSVGLVLPSNGRSANFSAEETKDFEWSIALYAAKYNDSNGQIIAQVFNQSSELSRKTQDCVFYY